MDWFVNIYKFIGSIHGRKTFFINLIKLRVSLYWIVCLLFYIKRFSLILKQKHIYPCFFPWVSQFLLLIFLSLIILDLMVYMLWSKDPGPISVPVDIQLSLSKLCPINLFQNYTNALTMHVRYFWHSTIFAGLYTHSISTLFRLCTFVLSFFYSTLTLQPY